MLVSMWMSRLSFQANAVKFPLVLTLTSPFVSFSFFGPKSEGMPFLLSRTVSHECILRLSKSSKSLGDENKLSINSLCPKPSTLQVKCLNSCLSCCHVVSGRVWVFTQVHSHVICIPWFVTQFVNFDTKSFLFFLGMYCLKIILPWNFTITSSTAKCSEGL